MRVHNLYTSQNIITVPKPRRLRWVGYVVLIVEMINLYKILIGIPEGKISSRRHDRRLEDNIRMDLRDI
jgi:hypothetical protein